MSSDDIVWRADADMVASSNLKRFMDRVGVADYDALLAWGEADLERCWAAVIDFVGIPFPQRWTKLMDTSRGVPWTRWCVGGKTNVVLSCIERHRGTPTERAPAIVWESEQGETREWLYADLDRETNRLAAGLRGLGLGPGDAVGLFMPMVPEVAAAYFAIQHIGALVVPLFSGFGAEAIATRLNDAEATAVLTVDATARRGALVPMKQVMDQALERVSTVRTVVVLNSKGHAVDWREGRDHWWHEVVSGQPERCPPAIVDAETPAMLVYTSGSTGRPKGTLHTHCSFVAKMAADMLICMDLKASDRLLWMSDFGWVVGPMQLIGGTLAGACVVFAEGVPDYPDPGRMWQLMERHRVTYLGVSPTTVRSLMRSGVEPVAACDLSSLRIVTSTGEPWTEEAWRWCFEQVGKGRVPIFNITGGTEVGGGILLCTVLHPLKPCCFGGPSLGVGADIVDERGRPVAAGEVGELVLRVPSIGLTRGVWKDPEKYLETYYSMYGHLWRQGDWARRDRDGLWYVEGRSDDTLKIAGKRTGPAEIEGLVMATGVISEAAAVGVPDPVSGQAVLCAMVPAPGVQPGPELEAKVAAAIERGLGKAFRPKRQIFVSDLPKTRNMKILRRVVKAVIVGEPPGDLTALLNPEAIEELRKVAGTTLSG